MKFVVMALIVSLGLTAQAQTVKPAPSAVKPAANVVDAEPDRFMQVMDEILRKSTKLNVLMDVRITPKDKTCFVKKGDKFTVSLLLKDVLKFDFAKADQDPMYAMMAEAAQAGLAIVSEITVGDNCAYHINAGFYQYNENNKQFQQSNLVVRLNMALTGQLLAFRIHGLTSTLSSVKKEGKEESEYEFIGEFEADQELTDFQQAALRMKQDKDAKEGIAAPEVSSWQSMEAKLIYKDGQLTIPVKSNATLPTTTRRTNKRN